MKPHSVGRTLGIGLRVAGRLAGQRAAASMNASPTADQPTAQPPPSISAQSRAVGQSAAQATTGLTRGVRGFLRPFRRVGGILWLEVSGVFFALPVLVVSPYMWHTRASYLQGPDHKTFLTSVIIMIVFLYLSVSSFWRARRK
jgi:hypothetical protein